MNAKYLHRFMMTFFNSNFFLLSSPSVASFFMFLSFSASVWLVFALNVYIFTQNIVSPQHSRRKKNLPRRIIRLLFANLQYSYTTQRK